MLPTDPAKEGNAWGSVICMNDDCPASPRVSDGADVIDERGSEAYKQAAIERWNKSILENQINSNKGRREMSNDQPLEDFRKHVLEAITEMEPDSLKQPNAKHRLSDYTRKKHRANWNVYACVMEWVQRYRNNLSGAMDRDEGFDGRNIVQNEEPSA